jgi:hypothetical protein
MYAHLSNARRQIKRLDAELHVIAVVFNPIRFVSRYNLFESFKKHVEDSGAKLWVVELAFGERPLECAEPGHPRHIIFRTDQELWHKEAMINAAVARLPHDWKYCAWVDADVTFVNPDWVHETMQQLQHYKIVQMFTHAIDLGPNGEPIDNFESWGYSYLLGNTRGGPPKIGGVHRAGGYHGKYWHPGFGWAYRREAWNTLGGMLDINIIGGADHQMAYGLIGRIAETIPNHAHPNYVESIKNWGRHASLLKKDVGAVPNTLLHHWHGRKVSRGYHDRWKIITTNKFDPLIDIRHDWQGMWSLSGNKPKMRDELRAYFRQRNEDGVEQ